MRVELSGFIERDLEEIADWIAEDNPRRAIASFKKFAKHFSGLATAPSTISFGLTSGKTRG